MKTKDILYELRTKKGLSQDELAEKVYEILRHALIFVSVDLGTVQNSVLFLYVFTFHPARVRRP